MSNEEAKEKYHRPIRSFVLRTGRLTVAQQNALDNYWKDYGIDFSEKLLDFAAIFGNDAPITLEIGFGNGESLLKQAIDNPERNFLGIEVHTPGVGLLIAGAKKAGISNLRVMRYDAVEVLSHQIPENSLDKVQLFFPDPWHKKRHNKRRILQDDFVESIRKHLKIGGHFHMATDWENYAEHMLETMNQHQGFFNTAGDAHFVPAQGLRPETKFERRGLKLGHGVWDMVYEKKG
ncbi:MAG: tRNA (guanosine(46)-N7)-methyltransferase TrmB [Gammaproteobacteria bacterium]|nr:tRNA (guanosine(46)-N7)-methyltransferase TrmB [Gammaproteobacteria bacterium]